MLFYIGFQRFSVFYLKIPVVLFYKAKLCEFLKYKRDCRAVKAQRSCEFFVSVGYLSAFSAFFDGVRNTTNSDFCVHKSPCCGV